MAASIKATMGVDGASKFRSDLNSAKQSVKELDSELKLAESQFKATGDKEQYMSDRSSALKQQIDAQENVIRLLNNQLKQATEKYGANSDKVSKLKTELNKAKTSQNNMKTALNQTETPLEETANDTGTLAEKMTEAADKTADLDKNMQDVAAHLDLQAVQNFANNVASAIESAAKKAKDLAVQVWNLGTEAGTTADEWLTMSTQYGISVEDLQKWSYAGRFVDTTLENITGSMVRFRMKYSDVREAFDELTALQNRRANTSDKTELAQLDKRIESLQEKALSLKNNFGIDIYDAQHNLRSTADVYWEMIDVIGNAYNNGQQELAEQAAMDFFGRSAANLNPLFKAGKDAFMQLGEEAEQMGYIMSETDVQALGAFDDQTQKLKASIDSLKLNMANDLLPLLQQVADGFMEISDGILEYLESEEGKAAISGMAESIGGVLGNLSDDIPGAISTVTGYVTDFAQGFKDAEGAVQTVITAVETLAAVWAASKLVSFGAGMIEASKTIGNFFSGLLGKGGTGTATVVGGSGTTAAGGGLGALLGKFFTSTGAKVGGGVFAGISTLFGDMVEQFKAADQRLKEINETGLTEEIEEQAESIGDTLEDAESIISGNMHEWEMSAKEAANAYIAGENPADSKPFWTQDEGTKNALQLAKETEKYTDALTSLDSAMQDLFIGNGDFGLRESLKELQTFDVESIFSPDVIEGIFNFDDIPADDFAAWVAKLREQLAQAAGQAGTDAGTGLAEGISGSADVVNSAGEATGQSGVNGIQSGANATIARLAGFNVARGFANGILNGAGLARGAARTLGAGATQSLKATMLIGSPSKVMEDLGMFTAEGFANGIEGGVQQVGTAVNRMLGAVNATPVYGAAGGSAAGSGANQIASALNGAVVVMDGETVGRLVFPYINNEMGEVTARRYAS